MQFTQEQINWYNQVVSSGQMTAEAAMAALTAAMQPAAAPVPQAVEQHAQPMTGAASHQVMGSVAAPNPMNNMLAAFQSIADDAAEEEDHAAIVSGKPPRAGIAWIRFRGYIEIGVHQGKNTTYAPKPIALVVVELHHPDHLVDEGGVKVPKELTIRISKTHSQNSKFPKFFKAIQRALRVDGQQDITHLSQAIGRCCLAEVFHGKSEDGSKIYPNLDQDNAWSFKSNVYQDPATGAWQQVTIPEMHGTPLLFMIDNAAVNKHPENVKTMWDSIHIPGTRETQDAAGNKKQISLNYYQEIIAKSEHWAASETKRLLDSLGCVTTFGATPNAQSTNSAPAMPAQVPAAGVPAMGYEQPAVPQAAPVYHEPAPMQQVPMGAGEMPVQAASAGAGNPMGITGQPVPHQQYASPEGMAQAVAGQPVQAVPTPQAMAAAPAMGMPQMAPQQAPAPVEQPAAMGVPAGVPAANGMPVPASVPTQQPAMAAPPAPVGAAAFMQQFQ